MKKQQTADRVRKYLWHFCRLCNDSPDKCRNLPNRKVLLLIEKTLGAIYQSAPYINLPHTRTRALTRRLEVTLQVEKKRTARTKLALPSSKIVRGGVSHG